MNPVHGAVLGIIQGLTEPLPISSSAHLVTVPWLLGWSEHSLTFDVALHMGTLAALLLYFWRDLWLLAAAWLPQRAPSLGIVQGAPATEVVADALHPVRGEKRRLGVGLVVGSIPAAVIGAFYADRIEENLRSPVLIAMLLLAGAALLAAADRAGVRRLGLDSVGITRALIIGLAQALALAPGVSRSGITLTTALFLGLTRESGARYAFLLGIPVTAGAGVFKLRHLLRDGIPPDERGAFALGVLASLVVGVLAIRGLMGYVRHRNLDVFVAYRIGYALLIFLVAAVRAG